MKKFFLLQLLLLSGLCLKAQTIPIKDLQGRVTCGNKGVQGVIVTDGTDCVQTDAQGIYHLEAKRNVRFVYLTTPGRLPRPLPRKDHSTVLPTSRPYPTEKRI